MPDRIDEFLKRPTATKRKPDRIDEFLKAPVVAQPAAPPSGPGFVENLEIGGRRALLTAADAGRAFEDAVNAAGRGDLGPLGQLIESAGRGVVSAAGFLTAGAPADPKLAEISAQREQRMDAQPELFSKEARAERQRLDVRAGQDPSLAGKITRRATEGVLTAAPSIVAGVATGGSAPAMAAVSGFQSLNQPEVLIPNIALAAAPIPLGRVVAPIVRRIKAGKVAPSVPARPAAPTIDEFLATTPIAQAEPALPAIGAPPSLPTPAPVAPRAAIVELTAAQQEAAALNSAIQKLGTDSVDEIAEMIANSNRRFNRTVTAPGQAKRKITPAERQSMRDDYDRVKALTKEENAALAEVLPERGTSPVFSEPIPSQGIAAGESRNISDISIDEPSAQLDANLRQLLGFFESQGLGPATRIDLPIAVRQIARGQLGKGKMIEAGQIKELGLPVDLNYQGGPIERAASISIDDIVLGRDDLSPERLLKVASAMKKGGLPAGAEVDPIMVSQNPITGKWAASDGNHRIAILKLGGYKGKLDVIAETSPEISMRLDPPTTAISTAVGPRASEISPMEVEIGRQLNQATRPNVTRNLDPLEVESMEGARQAPLFDPQRNLAPLEVAPMKTAEQLPLMDVAQKKRLRKALNLMADAIQIPRALMSSADISAPFRQGAILSLPPSRWGKALRSTVEMFRALVPDKPTSVKGGIKAQFQPKTERYQRMVDAIASDPDAQVGQNHGLKLTSQTRDGLRKAEEDFVSRTADRIPIVRESQQAYTAYIDNTRLNTFKLYKDAIDKQGFTPDQMKRGYEAAARWINIASGRGSFGEKADRAMDALNFFIFSPRFVASRMQVLNPMTYLRNAGTAEGRVVLKKQMSEMAQFAGMVGGTLLLAKAAGFKVGQSPDKPDFLRLSLGNYHYDGLAGLQPVMRLIYGLGADAARAARGEKPEEGRTALDVGARFLRSKAAPIPSYFVDFLDRKTFEGKPFDATKGAIERVTPMMWGDMAEAFQREGIGGPLMLSPGAIGFGAQYFEPKPIDAAIEKRPGLMNELVRLQIRIKDPRRKEGEGDQAYKGRQEAIADLYGRFGVSLMSNRDYARLPDQDKQGVFDLLHSRILDAVNTRDRRTGQFQAGPLIQSLRQSKTQKTIRERLISRRPAL